MDFGVKNPSIGMRLALLSALPAGIAILFPGLALALQNTFFIVLSLTIAPTFERTPLPPKSIIGPLLVLGTGILFPIALHDTVWGRCSVEQSCPNLKLFLSIGFMVFGAYLAMRKVVLERGFGSIERLLSNEKWRSFGKWAALSVIIVLSAIYQWASSTSVRSFTVAIGPKSTDLVDFWLFHFMAFLAAIAIVNAARLSRQEV